MPTLREVLTDALKLHEAGDLDRAERIYRDVLRAAPDQPTALHFLGVIHYQRGRHGEAIELIGRALSADPTAAAHCNLGSAFQAAGRLTEAETHFRRALELAPIDADTLNNLGNLLQLTGRLTEAETSYRGAIEVRPDHADAHRSLGRVLYRLGRFEEAARSLERALALRPGFPDALNDLGLVAREFGLLSEAETLFRKAIDGRPDFAEAQVHMGLVLQESGRADEALIAFEQAISANAELAAAHVGLAALREQQGESEEAAAAFRTAARLLPGQPLLKLRLARVSPGVFDSTADIDRYRDDLMAAIRQCDPQEIRLADVAAFGAPPPLDLMFHGRDDRAIKEAYAGLFQGRLPESAPAPPADRPRVGIVVTRGHEGAFLRCMAGILERLNPDTFEVLVLCSRSGQERIRGGIGSRAVRSLAIPQRLDLAAEAVRSARCDVLYYWEVGTDPLNYFLPFFRLAPQQCTGWGVPVTTGISTVDGYLSSDLLEPEGADSHYSERLLSARTLLTFQKRVALSSAARGRESFGLPADGHLYVCAQQLGKLHPDFDAILAEILRRDDRGRIVLVEDRYGAAARRLRARFQRDIPDVADRIVFLPRQSLTDYLHLLSAADVLLDPLHTGGGLTVYDGLSLNRPLVTCPGSFARGRYALACYRKMDFAECVAARQEDYAPLAVRLATDVPYRRHVEEQIQATSDRLFEDVEAGAEFERLLADLVPAARAR